MGAKKTLGWGVFLLSGACAGACGSERHEPEQSTKVERTPLEESSSARSRILELRTKLPGRGTATHALHWLHESSPGIGFSTDGSAVYPILGEEVARVSFPKHASESVRLADPKSGIEVAFELLDANAAAEVEVAEGLVLYRNALVDADLVHRPRSDGTEDFFVFERAPRVPVVSYRLKVEAVPGLRLVENTLELLDRDGAPRLRVAPPFVIDADGRKSDATLSLSGCNLDRDPRGPWGRPVVPPDASECRLDVRWSADIRPPFVLDPAWTTTAANLTTGVMLPHVAALTNGKVLIAGGCPNFNYSGWRCEQQATAASYLFDPATDTIATTDSMTVRRSQAAMTRMASGDVLIAGGWELSAQNSSAEVYKVATGMWQNTGSLSHTLHRGTATALPSGKVLVTAGVYSGAIDNLRGWIYDPAANGGVGAFASPVVFQPYYGRFDHSATLLTNGKVLVAGGDNGSSFPGAGASALFDPAAGGVGAWSAGPALAQGRAGHVAARLPDGRVLVAGGFFDPGPAASTTLASAEIYDPVANTFAALPAMNSEHAFPAWTVLGNGAVLIASGAIGSCSTACSFPSGTTTAVDIFEPGANQFRVAPVMPAARLGAGAALLSTGSALVVSGVTSATPPSDAAVSIDAGCNGHGLLVRRALLEWVLRGRLLLRFSLLEWLQSM